MIPRIGIAKEAFKKKIRLLCSKLNSDLQKKLAECFVPGVALYSSEAWTLRKDDMMNLEVFEMWALV